MNIETELQKRIKTQLGDKDYRTLKLSYGFCLKFAQDVVVDVIRELGFDLEIVDDYIDPKEILKIKQKEYAKERGMGDFLSRGPKSMDGARKVGIDLTGGGW